MKKLVCLLLVFAFAGCLLFLPSCSPAEQTVSFQGISFSLPGNWKVSEPYYYDTSGGMLMVSSAPLESAYPRTQRQSILDGFMDGSNATTSAEWSEISPRVLASLPTQATFEGIVSTADGSSSVMPFVVTFVDDGITLYIFSYMGKAGSVINKVVLPSIVSIVGSDAAAPTPSPTPEPTPTPEPLPVISGSYVGDIKIGLRDVAGIPEASPSRISDGYEHVSDLTEVDGFYVDYTITTSPNYEIAWCSITVSNPAKKSKSKFQKFAKNFLGYCSTLPYDSADSDAARSWLEDAVSGGKESTKTIGRAIFTYTPYVNGDGAELSIKAVGYTEYLERKWN